MPAPTQLDTPANALSQARLQDAELRLERKRQAGKRLLLSTLGAGLALIVAGHLLFQGLFWALTHLGVWTPGGMAWGIPALGLVSVMLFMRLFRRLEKARAEHAQQSEFDEELVERLRTELPAEAYHVPKPAPEETVRPATLRRG